MPDRIVVTGASSYLGGRAVERLARGGTSTVIALCSPRASELNPGNDPRVRRICADLSRALPSEVVSALGSADRVLHFAWDRHGDATGSNDRNRAMAEALLAHCHPSSFVFVSSVAGAPDAASAYGRHKHEIAGRVLAAGGSVFVPGLVVEQPPAGPYAILDKVVRRLPVALRISHGAPMVYPVAMARLLDMVDRLADPDLPPGTWRGFDAPVAFNDFLAGIEAQHLRHRVTITLPARLLLATARVTKALPLPTRAYADKILTFLQKNDAHLAGAQPLPPPSVTEPRLSLTS